MRLYPIKTNVTRVSGRLLRTGKESNRGRNLGDSIDPCEPKRFNSMRSSIPGAYFEVQQPTIAFSMW